MVENITWKPPINATINSIIINTPGMDTSPKLPDESLTKQIQNMNVALKVTAVILVNT